MHVETPPFHASTGQNVNRLWLLKNSITRKCRKNFALGSPTNDVLSFPRHFLSLQFGGLGRKGSFSTATPVNVNHRKD
jgi:hypothetical protein